VSKLNSAACIAVIAMAGIYATNAVATWHKERVGAQAVADLAAIQLCAQKRAEEEKYRGGMDWTGVKANYVKADKYCH